MAGMIAGTIHSMQVGDITHIDLEVGTDTLVAGMTLGMVECMILCLVVDSIQATTQVFIQAITQVTIQDFFQAIQYMAMEEMLYMERENIMEWQDQVELQIATMAATIEEVVELHKLVDKTPI